MNTSWSVAFVLLFVLAVSESQEIGDVNLCTLNGMGTAREDARSSSGILEVFTEVGWSVVDSFGFGGVEAQVVCVQLGFTFVANVSIISTTSRKLDNIINSITCNGTEKSISDCVLNVTESPSASSSQSLVHITCDTVRNATDGIILFLLDSPYFMRINYPKVDASLHTTYSMIEPSQNTYKEGCLTDVCTPGGHFYTLGTASFEGFYLEDIRNSDCSKTNQDDLPLVEFGFINDNDCTYTTTNKIVIGKEEKFCSVTSTRVINTAVAAQPTIWLWNLMILSTVYTLLK